MAKHIIRCLLLYKHYYKIAKIYMLNAPLTIRNMNDEVEKQIVFYY